MAKDVFQSLEWVGWSYLVEVSNPTKSQNLAEEVYEGDLNPYEVAA